MAYHWSCPIHTGHEATREATRDANVLIVATVLTNGSVHTAPKEPVDVNGSVHTARKEPVDVNGSVRTARKEPVDVNGSVHTARKQHLYMDLRSNLHARVQCRLGPIWFQLFLSHKRTLTGRLCDLLPS